MAQTFFDVLTGSIDNQTTSAVQSILDGQTVDGGNGHFGAIRPGQELEDDDIFQCGKCKRQFTSLATFVSHKQARCQDQPQAQSTTANPPLAPQQVILQGRMISDDIGGSFDPLQTTILQVQGANIKSNPFLSQIGPLTAPSQSLEPAGHERLPLSVSGPEVELTSDQSAVFVQVEPEAAKTQKGEGRKQANKLFPRNLTARQELEMKRSRPETELAVKDKPKLSVGAVKEKTKLFCQYCSKAFTKNFDLSVHIRTHTGEKPYQCIVCGRAFAQKSNVKKHMASHKVWPRGRGETLPEYAFVTVVDQQSTDESTNQKDLDGLTAQNPSDGSEAKQSGSESQVLGVMMDTSYQCEYCDERFETYNLLKKHMPRHKNEQVYKCVLQSCASSFKDMDSFLEHVKMHERELTYNCHMCNQEFKSLYDLGLHQYDHSSIVTRDGLSHGGLPGEAKQSERVKNLFSSTKGYNCSKCTARYTSREALDHHLQTSTHNYPCVFCKRVFVCERYLRRHVLIHNVKSLECRLCQKRFNTPSYLRIHLKTHSSDRPFKCDRCDAAFNRKDKLRRHTLIHNPDKRFKCPFKKMIGCEKEFTRADKLRDHILTHGGHRPWACAICNKLFSRASHAKQHQKTHYKPCQQCKKNVLETDMASHECIVTEACEPNPEPETEVHRDRPKRTVVKPKKYSDYSDPTQLDPIRPSIMRLRVKKEKKKTEENSVQSVINERNSGVTMSLQSLIDASRMHEQQLITETTSNSIIPAMSSNSLIPAMSSSNSMLPTMSSDSILPAMSSNSVIPTLASTTVMPNSLVQTSVNTTTTEVPSSSNSVPTSCVVPDTLLPSSVATNNPVPASTLATKVLPAPLVQNVQPPVVNQVMANPAQYPPEMTQISVMTNNGMATIPVVFTTQNGDQFPTYQISADNSVNLVQTLSECLANHVVESNNPDGTITLSVCYPPNDEQTLNQDQLMTSGDVFKPINVPGDNRQTS